MSKINKIIWSIFTILQLLDFVTTYIGINYLHTVELNPVFKYVFNWGISGWILAAFLKIIVVPVIFYRLMLEIDKQDAWRFSLYRILSLFLVGMYILVVANNLFVLLEVIHGF